MVLDHAIHIVFIELFTGVAGQFLPGAFGVVGQIVIEIEILGLREFLQFIERGGVSFTIIWANCFTLGFLLLAATIFPSSISALLPWAALVTKS